MVAVGCCQSGEGEERSQDHFVVVASSGYQELRVVFITRWHLICYKYTIYPK